MVVIPIRPLPLVLEFNLAELREERSHTARRAQLR